nr:putative integron gene cassette protein [uncultured bacterium]
MRCVHRLRKLRFLSSSFRLCMLSLLTGPAESSRGALMLSCFGVRQVRRGFISTSIPPA